MEGYDFEKSVVRLVIINSESSVLFYVDLFVIIIIFVWYLVSNFHWCTLAPVFFEFPFQATYTVIVFSKFVLTYLFVLFFILGRYDLVKYEILCEDCSQISDVFDLTNLISSGYWPGTPTSTNYLFSIDLFKFWDAFRKRMPGISQNSFLQSLCDVSLDNGRVSILFH